MLLHLLLPQQWLGQWVMVVFPDLITPLHRSIVFLDGINRWDQWLGQGNNDR